MALRLANPGRPAAPTAAYQLVIDLTLAAPKVAETPTIGYPYEISKLVISSDTAVAEHVRFSLLVVLNPWLAGETRGGYLLHQIAGDDLGTEPRDMVYRSSSPLVLRPRIRVTQPGTRIRLVQDTATPRPSLRVQLFLTALE